MIKNKIKFKDFFENAELKNLLNTNIKNENFCNEVIKEKDNSYYCIDCSNISNIILCENCFKNSEHINHNFQIKISFGTCDCGNKEALNPIYYCKFHNGNNKIKDNFSKEFMNSVVYDWKNKILFIFNELNNILNKKNSIYDIEEIFKIIKKFIKANKKNILIVKILSLALLENLENINNEYILIRNEFLSNLNKKNIELNNLKIDIDNLNLNDIILTLDYNNLNQTAIIKDLFYSLFNSMEYKLNLTFSYVKVFNIISLNLFKINDKHKFGLNFQLFNSKKIKKEIFNYKYYQNYLKTIYLLNLKDEKYIWYNNRELNFFIISIYDSIENLLVNEENIKILIKIFIHNFLNTFNIYFDNLSDITWINKNIEYLIQFIYYFEEILCMVIKIKNNQLVNLIIKNFIKEIIKIKINYLRITYNEDINKINYNDLKDNALLVIEIYLSIAFSYYINYNKCLKFKKDIFKNLIEELLIDFDKEIIVSLFKINLMNIIKFYKNIFILSLFYKSIAYNLISYIEFFNTYYLSHSYIFLMQIIKIILGDFEFFELFLKYYFGLKIEDNNFLNNYFIKNNYYIIIKYLKLEDINSKDLDKKEFYIKNLNNILDLDDYNEFKNKYYSKNFYMFFDLIYKISNFPVLLYQNEIKLENENDYIIDLVKNFLNISKKISYDKLLTELNKNNKFFYLHINNKFNNILNSLITENFNFDKNTSLIDNLENNFNIDQTIYFLNYNYFNKMLKSSENMNKFNIFNLNSTYNFDYINKNIFINIIIKFLKSSIFNNNLEILSSNISKKALDEFIIIILFILNEKKEENIELIKDLSKYSNENEIFNMILKKTDENNLNYKNILKEKKIKINDILDKIKKIKLKKFMTIKIEKISININNCIICKKSLESNIVYPIQIIQETKYNKLMPNSMFNYDITSCYHCFHLDCINKLTINYKCYYCKKKFYTLLIYDNNLNNDEIYYFNLETIEYYSKYHLEFESIIEELIKIYIFNNNKDKKINDLLIFNICWLFGKIYNFEKLLEIYNNLNKYAENIENFEINEFKSLNLFFKTLEYNFIKKFLNLIFILIEKLNIENKFNFESLENKIFSNNKLQITDYNKDKKSEFLKFIDISIFLPNYKEFKKNIIYIKCEYCSLLDFEKLLNYCIICNIYFCHKKNCYKNLSDCNKHLNNKDNLYIHNNLCHSNYGIYYCLKSNEIFIIFNNKLFNTANLYMNSLNQPALYNILNSDQFTLNKNILEKLIDTFVNKNLKEIN